MKVTVDFDCTPEEVRRLVGLPDLSPLHEAYLSRMQSAVEQGITPDSIQSIIQAWGPIGQSGLALWRQMIERAGVTLPK